MHIHHKKFLKRLGTFLFVHYLIAFSPTNVVGNPLYSKNVLSSE